MRVAISIYICLTASVQIVMKPSLIFRLFSTGLAFCALLATLLGDQEIQFDSLTNADQAANFERAFSLAERHGVARYLDVKDMVEMDKPDPFSVMTYVSTLYHAFK